MGKRRLISFLKELDNSELQEQVVDLYTRFKNVKEYYDFSFNPNEDKRLLAAKERIAREYFPEAGKKVKKRRSVGHKIITQFLKLEVNPVVILDFMLYNIEVAQLYTSEVTIKQEAFYKSMLKSFEQAVDFANQQFIRNEFDERIIRIVDLSHEQEWINKQGFTRVLNNPSKG